MTSPGILNSVEAASGAPDQGHVIKIHSGSAGTRPPANVVAGAAAVRPYSNDQQNSRLPLALAAGTWKIGWQADLNAYFPISFVLAGGDRILLQGEGRWQLLDDSGHSLKAGERGAGDAIIDPATGLFYVIDLFGMLEAYHLADGELDYSVSISGGNEWTRSFYARSGQRFAIVSFERKIQPNDSVTPNSVAIDVQDLGQPPQIKDQIVVSAKRESRLYYKVPSAFGALLFDVLVVGMENKILITHFGKTVQAQLEDRFSAGPLSLDESGRIYVLVSNEEHRVSLWALTQGGELVAAFDAPADLPIKWMPPVVGYDHRIYLVSGDSIVCLSPEGKLLWRQSAGGTIAGLAAIPSGGVLVSAGTALVRLDDQGARHIVYEFPGEPLSTPPSMTKAGDLLVATQKHLYCLRIH